MSQDTVKNYNEVERVEELKRRLATALKRVLQEEQASTQRKDDTHEKPDQAHP